MGRILAFNFAGYTPEGGSTAVILKRGDGVPDEAVESLEEAGALVPEGLTLDQHLDAKLNAYRGQRGDAVAAQALREQLAAAQGGIVDVSGSGLASGASLTERIRDQKLTADETVALAEGDPAKAQEVLTAESEATGGEPRKTVAEPLQKLIDGASE